MNKDLHKAAGQGDIETVLSILDSGGNVQEVGPNHWPLLVRAAANGHAALVEKLLERGADKDARDSRDGKTALHWAALMDQIEVVELLLRQGIPVDTRDTYALFTPLLLAAASARDDRAQAMVELLLNWGADIEARNEYGTTALMFAAVGNDTMLLHFLMGRGADVNARANSGETALCTTAYLGFRAQDTLPILLAYGADPDLPDSAGRTPLMWTALHAKREIAELLLRANANLSLQDHAGWTALMHAAGPAPRGSNIWALADRTEISEKSAKRLEEGWQRRAEMVRFLLEQGADPTTINNDGGTALEIASGLKGSRAVVEALSNGLRKEKQRE